LRAIFDSGAEPSYIPRGLGRSYGDAALNLNGGAVCPIRLNRFLSFDSQTGILECESGVSFAEIIQFFLPRGFFLPVTPGTKFVTVGGAIAADIHGKNHHRNGAFSNFVRDLQLLTPPGEILTCSRQDNSEIFWATVGGMGLTGIVLSARIQLERVESAFVAVDYQRTRSLNEALDVMTESDERYRYSVAWVDCLAQGDSLGRSVLMRANHATAAEASFRLLNALTPPPRIRLSVPFEAPAAALNPFTLRAFNALYYRRHEKGSHRIVDFERFFYPLDAIENWNRLYGKRGFVQYQVALPAAGGREAVAVLLERLAQSGRASFLAVLKRFGEADQALLGFPLKGYTLALDLPADRDLVTFLNQLDDVVLEHGGRVYLAKDAALRPETFAAMYPNLDRFRAVKEKLDRKGLLSSSLARRLRIVNG
jgi:decaprenylphospho-beta-D-ribofuranose 2-oxidase